ncbi:formyltransferase family protein [Algicella marina]|uniref:Formyl transferase N-terminal domain-containing protein n=1 Tax=Algicella marina TaxID=2683284 RepID=A0A6P1T2Q8_9RHOB|nr:formyltransferase family protein [Algicella marina]QHQ35756.1 hypothetical protein GO499_11505 [Algicella marina]
MRIAFLGYGRDETRLIGLLEAAGHDVEHFRERVESLADFDLILSFGYRFILKKPVISTARRPILNLHISYLPYNRGAHPNFWSWIEDTPAGVTIHEIDLGLDTGGIAFQTRLAIEPEDLSFRDTYVILVEGIEQLFEDNLTKILAQDYQIVQQPDGGTYHRASELPDWVNWDMKISSAVARYHGVG